MPRCVADRCCDATHWAHTLGCSPSVVEAVVAPVAVCGRPGVSMAFAAFSNFSAMAISSWVGSASSCCRPLRTIGSARRLIVPSALREAEIYAREKTWKNFASCDEFGFVSAVRRAGTGRVPLVTPRVAIKLCNGFADEGCKCAACCTHRPAAARRVMGCGASKDEASAAAIQSLDQIGDVLPTRVKASRSHKIPGGAIGKVMVTISDATSGKELLKISPVKTPAQATLYKCKIEGKAASLTYEAGKLKNGRTLLYTAKQSVQKMDGSMAKLVTFERRAGSGTLPPAEVSCAIFTDNGRTEYVVYNQRFASANEAAQGISRSTIVARATIGQHVVDDPSKLIPVNGKLPIADDKYPFQLKGIAEETELCLPRDAIEELEAAGGAGAPLEAFLFFAALPLLDITKDQVLPAPGFAAVGFL